MSQLNFLLWQKIDSTDNLKEIYKRHCIHLDFNETVFEWLREKNIIGYLTNVDYIGFSAHPEKILKENVFKNTTICYSLKYNWEKQIYFVNQFGKTYLVINKYKCPNDIKINKWAKTKKLNIISFESADKTNITHIIYYGK